MDRSWKQGWKTRCELLDVGCQQRPAARRSLCKGFTTLGLTREAKRSANVSATGDAEKDARWRWMKRPSAAGVEGKRSGPDQPVGLPGALCDVRRPTDPSCVADDGSRRTRRTHLFPLTDTSDNNKLMSTADHVLKRKPKTGLLHQQILYNGAGIKMRPLHINTSCDSQLVPMRSKFLKEMLTSTASSVQL